MCELDLEETARLIATGRGVRGTSLEYLENVAERLRAAGPQRSRHRSSCVARVREVLGRGAPDAARAGLTRWRLCRRSAKVMRWSSRARIDSGGTPVSQQVKAELAPTGVLRAGINLSNFLLVSGKTDGRRPRGRGARHGARRSPSAWACRCRYVTYKTPGELADAAETGAWDIGLIGAEPQRAEKIAFTPAYVEIEATYLVPAGSPLQGDRRCRQAGRAHRRDGAQRLRPLARPQHQAGASWCGRARSTAPASSS